MSVIDIRRLDATLLLIFAELMTRRKLTAVAAHLHVTQSSISHALNRLRDIFGDELFLRRPNGVEPTPRAIELEPLVRSILEQMRLAVAPRRPFEPAQADAVVRISMPDHHCALMAAPLLKRVRRAAPRLQISIRPEVRRPALDALRANELDLALGYFRNPPAGLTSRRLFEDGHSVVARKRHPRLRGGQLSVAQYLASEHVLVSLGGDLEGIVDTALGKLGRKRTLVAGLPFFLPTLNCVSCSDLIATIPRRPAAVFAKTFGLDVFEPPVKIPSYTTSVLWHARNDGNELLQWVIDLIAEITRSAECGAPPP